MSFAANLSHCNTYGDREDGPDLMQDCCGAPAIVEDPFVL